jgi:hypothetical protein
MSLVSMKKSGKYVSCHVTPAVDLAIYADGDMMFQLEKLENIVPVKGGLLKIKDIMLINADDEAIAMDILILSNTFTEASANNAAFAETAANMQAYLKGIVEFAAADWTDLINSQAAHLRNLDLLVSAEPGSQDLYLLAISRGTPDFAAITDLDIIINGELSLDQ